MEALQNLLEDQGLSGIGIRLIMGFTTQHHTTATRQLGDLTSLPTGGMNQLAAFSGLGYTVFRLTFFS